MDTIVTLGPGDTTTPPPSVFTPPSSCSSLYTYEQQIFNNVTGGLLLQNALGTPRDTECYPAGVTDYGRVSHIEIYSPGVCPVGYTTPAQYVSSSTTTVICCPKSLQYTTILTSFGDSASDAELYAGCIATLGVDDQTKVPYYDANFTVHSYTTVTGPITMWAQPMQFAFQQKDLSLFTTSATKTSATSTTAAAAPSSTVSSLAPSSTASSPVTSGSNGLSTGAKAGIGVGVAVAAILLIMALLFFLLAKRKQKRNMGNMGVNTGIQGEGPPYNDEPPKPGPGMVETGPRALYLDSTERIEMPHPSNMEHRVSEMPAHDSHR